MNFFIIIKLLFLLFQYEIINNNKYISISIIISNHGQSL
jgi:hypothetical protein